MKQPAFANILKYIELITASFPIAALATKNIKSLRVHGLRSLAVRWTWQNDTSMKMSCFRTTMFKISVHGISHLNDLISFFSFNRLKRPVLSFILPVHIFTSYHNQK